MRTKNIPIVFASRDGKVVQIEDVESGLNCNCYCLECNSKLVAHKGEKVIQHFKHYDKVEKESCFETAIHFASKNLFAENKTVLLPDLKVFVDELGYTTTIFKERKFTIQNVFIEQPINNFKPDVYVEIVNKSRQKVDIIPLIIEIAVTHFVDNEKMEKIEKSGISAIEISLKNVNRICDEIDLWCELSNPENIKWLYNRNEKNLIRKRIEQITAIEKNKEISRKKDELNNEIEKQDLKKQGFLLLKIYNGRKEYLGGTVDNYCFSGTIYCPKENNSKIQREDCEKCIYNHDQFKDYNEDDFRMVCGFKNKKTNPIISNDEGDYA